MFKAARQAKIKEILLDQNQIDVQTLSSLLNVSVVTIRSDLEELEREGFVLRTHGGAVLNDSRTKPAEAPFALGPREYSKEKDHIAQIAAHLIENQEWVFLGAGEICQYIAKELLGRETLNIVTNNIVVANILAQNRGSNVIVTGGNLNHTGMFLSGEIFNRSLSSLFISKAFFEVAGVDFKGGYTVSSIAEAQVFESIRPIAKEVIIVADYQRFGEISFMKLGNLEAADTVISNEKMPEEYKTYYFNNKIKIFTSYKINPSSIGENS